MPLTGQKHKLRGHYTLIISCPYSRPLIYGIVPPTDTIRRRHSSSKARVRHPISGLWRDGSLAPFHSTWYPSSSWTFAAEIVCQLPVL